MFKLAVKTVGAVCFAAFVLPGVLAPAASAYVSSIKVAARDNTDCTVAVGDCRIYVTVKGDDVHDPITVKVDDVALGECPIKHAGKDYLKCELSWSPAANGTYVISATRGTRTESVTLNIPGRVEQDVATGSADWLGRLGTGSLG
ncbi:hypothetical protein ABZ319_13235 [Nocardia sp. NPDC005978]|uniref:hypothetical protein n=1 Tax=Nocardia sp. NPDC005978 TaxID=3156725 RepID=UPI0033A05208